MHSNPVALARASIALDLRESIRPTAASTAARLGVSSRTLQRRLVARGTTFRLLLSECRRAIVDTELASPGRTISAIAYDIAMTPQSLSRAYKSWTGRPPSAGRSCAATAQPAAVWIPPAVSSSPRRRYRRRRA
jgi:AraC-like DNA-binding protein